MTPPPLLQWYRPHPLGEVTPFVAALARPPHFHPDFELNVLVEGRARFRIGGVSYETCAGQALRDGSGDGCLVAMRPMVEHEMIAASPDVEMWVLFLPFHGPTTSAGLSCPLQHLASNTPRRVRNCDLLPLLEACRSVGSSWSARGADELYSAAQGALQASGAASEHSIHPSSLRIARLLECDPTLGRADLASAARVSESELSRLFRRDFGVPLNQHRNRLRLRTLLGTAGTSATLLRRGLDAGFGSEASMFRVFKQETGCAPLDFLRFGASELANRTKSLTLLSPKP